MDITIRTITDNEIKELDIAGANGKFIAKTRVAIDCVDEKGHKGTCYFENSKLEKLGRAYIEAHCTLESNVLCGEEMWNVRISEDNYYNDVEKNPPKIVDVVFVSNKSGEDTEIWQKIDGDRGYLLRILCNEPFARWMTCDGPETGWRDRANVRPNITFRNGKETETITYKDWNGLAAYSDTFNPNFRSGGDIPHVCKTCKHEEDRCPAIAVCTRDTDYWRWDGSTTYPESEKDQRPFTKNTESAIITDFLKGACR